MFDWMETKGSSKSSAEQMLNSSTITQKHHRFQLSDLPLETRPQADEFWFPEHVTPWYFLPSYPSLPLTVRRRYNQLYALGNHEAFVGLERDLICPILDDILRTRSLPNTLAESLKNFRDEEAKHAQMFRLINKAAEPDLYKDTDFFLTNQEGKNSLSWLGTIARHYRLLGIWIWITI